MPSRRSTTVAAFAADTDLIRQSRLYLADRWNTLLAGSTHARAAAPPSTGRRRRCGTLAASEPDERAGMGGRGRRGDDLRPAVVTGESSRRALGQARVVRRRRFPSRRQQSHHETEQLRTEHSKKARCSITRGAALADGVLETWRASSPAGFDQREVRRLLGQSEAGDEASCRCSPS